MPEERRALFNVTGNQFTSLHHIPSWHTLTPSPLDAMHLLYLGAMNWIVLQVLVGPGVLNKGHANEGDPQILFNEETWEPQAGSTAN